MKDIIKLLDTLFLKAQLNDSLNVTEYCYYYSFHLYDITLMINKDGQLVELKLRDIDNKCYYILDYEQRRAYKLNCVNNSESKINGEQFYKHFIDTYESVKNMLNNYLKYCKNV